MRKLFLKPGFETIFALSLIVILGLPPVLLAQNQKDIEIKIENTDTLVNGKSIKELSKEERKYALRDIKNLTRPMMAMTDSEKMGSGQRSFYFSQRFSKHKDTLNNHEDNLAMLKTNRQHEFGLKRNAFDGMPIRPGRKNTQRFDYENVDNDGISTHIRFHVSDIATDDLKKMPHMEGGKFEIGNLSIVPEFNTGSTVLMFSLPEKTEAQVKLINSSGNIIFDEKVEGGHFSKTFGLALNGVYFLQVKQGNFVGAKRIIKEE